MSAAGENSKDDLISFVKGLNKEQADILILHLPKLIATLEEQGEHFLQIPFLRTG